MLGDKESEGSRRGVRAGWEEEEEGEGNTQGRYQVQEPADGAEIKT